MTLQQARKALNLSRKQLADKLEVSARTVEAWEQGLRVPNKWLEPKIAKLIQQAYNAPNCTTCNQGICTSGCVSADLNK